MPFVTVISSLDSYWMNQDIAFWDRASVGDEQKIITADNTHWILPVNAQIKTIVFHGSADDTVTFVAIRANG